METDFAFLPIIEVLIFVTCILIRCKERVTEEMEIKDHDTDNQMAAKINSSAKNVTHANSCSVYIQI